MADLVVIVPSRGRPEAAAEMVENFRQTCAAKTTLVFAVNEDDAELLRYVHLGSLDGVKTLATKSSTMVESLNLAAERVVAETGVYAVGFLGDDHRPRTVGWDKLYLEALRELGTGIVYSNDLLQGENLPTQCAMTADIIRTLGYMAPPSLRHMYVDNYWRDLGRIARCLRYLPDVIVEHMHPLAGKADWDAGHLRVNDAAVYDADADAYRAYPLLADAAKVLALRATS